MLRESLLKGEPAERLVGKLGVSVQTVRRRRDLIDHLRRQTAGSTP